jgi:hypothetical protein
LYACPSPGKIADLKAALAAIDLTFFTVSVCELISGLICVAPVVVQKTTKKIGIRIFLM